jgi:glycosyltransferase involved in cell wall biosynthesis
LKIGIFNSRLQGGASISAQRLYNGLKQIEDLQVRFFVSDLNKGNQGLIDDFEEIPSRPYLKNRYLNQIVKKSIINDRAFNQLLKVRQSLGLELFSSPKSRTQIEIYIKNLDVVNLHWVAGFLNYESFFETVDKPVIWTLHDESPFLTGEHYREKLIFDEKGVPQQVKVSESQRHFESKVENLKKRLFTDKKNITIITPSAWLKKESESSIFSNYKHFLIPYGLDTNIFRHRNREYAKEFLNIPQDKTSILFVADSIDNNRKGFSLLLLALNRIETSNMHLIIVGHASKVTLGKLYKFSYSYFGSVNGEYFLSLIYNASDYFIIPSIMDNLPNTALEAVCCGTPVLGFRTGGIPDIVQNGVNGRLSDEISVSGLEEILTEVLENKSWFNSDLISEEANKKYSLEKQAASYYNLFYELVK